jgi:hypothetical protein
MVRAFILVALLLASSAASGQATGTLHVTITLLDATQTPVPVARHTLLISDNPPTREPRRVVTSADGTINVTLPPGSYTVESDRPFGFLGSAYQWTSHADVAANRQTTLTLTVKNAEVLPAAAATADTSAPAAARDPSRDVLKWQGGVVTLWSPTSQAAGFVVDARGLLATARHGVGGATTVEVQVSTTVKVPARVLVAEPTQDVAIVWVDPRVLPAPTPLPLTCPSPTTTLDDGDEMTTITPSLRGSAELEDGEVTGFQPRGIETDMRLPFGKAGGPVFAGDYASVVGLTAEPPDTETSRPGDVLVVRAGVICEALAAARSKMAGAEPPVPSPLPVEPSRLYPEKPAATSSPSSLAGGIAPPVIASADFDVAFLTPPTLLKARERADWTGGRSVRPPQAEALLGRITDLGAWAEYFRDVPAVLIVRVTPKLVESFWMRVAREAARTQGAALPAFKDFKTNFLRLRVTCGSSDVEPVHPFVLEHAVADKRVVREGLYVLGPDALGPHCGKATLTLWSEQTPDKGDTIVIDQQVLGQIWQDFAPYRATGQ